MKDPAPYLEALGVSLPCAVQPDRAAAFDPALSVRLNHETFFLSDAGALESFRKAPLRYCGLLSDPVTQERFAPSADSPRAEHAGRQFYFQSAATRAEFLTEPERYAEPRRSMRPMPQTAPAPQTRPSGG